MTAEKIFTHPIAIVIYIAGALTLIYGAMQGWFGGKRIDQSKGSKPDPADCGGGRYALRDGIDPNITSSGLVIGLSPEIQCTRPIYDLENIVGADELCFDRHDIWGDSIDAGKGKEVPNYMMIGYNNQPSKKWRFNRQSGSKFCYVYDPTGKYKHF